MWLVEHVACILVHQAVWIGTAGIWLAGVKQHMHWHDMLQLLSVWIYWTIWNSFPFVCCRCWMQVRPILVSCSRLGRSLVTRGSVPVVSVLFRRSVAVSQNTVHRRPFWRSVLLWEPSSILDNEENVTTQSVITENATGYFGLIWEDEILLRTINRCLPSGVTVGPQLQGPIQKWAHFQAIWARWGIGGPFLRSSGARNLKLRHCVCPCNVSFSSEFCNHNGTLTSLVAVWLCGQSLGARGPRFKSIDYRVLLITEDKQCKLVPAS